MPFQGFAADKPIKDVKELAGNWQGWVTAEVGDERATGQFYLQDGKLMYRSSRTAGVAKLTEDGGKTTITVLPSDPTYRTGSARYEKVK